MQRTNNIKSLLLILVFLVVGVGECVAGVAYNQIKDGGVYTICNRLYKGSNRNSLSYNGTFAFGQEPTTAYHGYWIARANADGTFSFESYAVRGKYLNSNGIADSPTATGSIMTLSEGTVSGYVSLNTYIPDVGNKYLAGYADSHGFGASCYVTSKSYNTSYASDWDFTLVGNKPNSIEIVNYYNTNYPMLFSDDAKTTALAAIENAGTVEAVETAMDAFYCSAEDIKIKISNGSNNGNRYYIQQTSNTAISLTETQNDNCMFVLKYTGNGEFFVKHHSNNWYWGYLNSRNNAIGGTSDTKWAGKWRLEKSNTANPTGDIFLMKSTNSTTGYYYLHAANTPLRLTDWNATTDASKWTVELCRETVWTVNIAGGTTSDRVIFNGNEYTDRSTISTRELTATDVKTNINNRFVWGPIIDTENHTVTFEVRSTQETSITAGRFYQLQMYNREGAYYNPNGTGNLVDAVNSMNPRFKGSNIYLTGGNKASGGWTVELMGVPDNPYVTYLYVPNATSTSVQLQMQNGNYIDWQSQSQSAVSNINVVYISEHNSFWWKNPVYPWGNLNGINASVGKSGSTDGPIELFFHPVTTGEDYDIYKVMNTEAAVSCGSSSLVTTITNAGGTFFFVQKGTVLGASDFTINGEEPQSISKTENNSFIELTLTERAREVHEIATLAGITDMYGYYKLTADVSAPAQIAEFHGHLDGNFHKITGLTHAIFNKLDGAKISNLILEDVNITSGDIVGAIANTATGNSRVYNCGVLSGSVNGSTEAGSIVGRIEGNARVVNCYSYANVSGGTVAGIVGNNAGTSATKETVFNGTGTLVMNCAHFGRLSGSSVYPVFGGNDINNVSGVNTYNYYIYDADVTYTSPNSAQGTEETAYFNRFDFYRGILNSHRELAAMYIHGTQNVTKEQIENIAHWKYDSNVANYLSQEPWPKNITSTLSREIPSTDVAYKGKRVGTVSATFIINGHSETVALPLTDMNTDRWDYTYGKVVLPFANEFSGWTMPASGNTDYDNIITGWEVTNINGGTAGTYSNYNLCDPDCTAKDLYENNNYVWAQGGNFVVPKDVTAITFTAHIVRAVYLRDTHPDIAYNENYGSRVNLGSQISGTYNGKTVYNSMDDAFAKLEEKTNPADQAIVLVGNYHLNREFPQSTGVTDHQRKAVTIMSIDADNNQESDYCLYQFNTRGSGRVSMPPIRFDFVVSPGFAMASYTKGGLLAGIGIIHAKGWFETTETATLTMSEFEMRPDYYNQNSPVILNGGEFSRILMTSTNEYGTATDKLLYTKIGGKAYVETLNLGRTSSVPASSVVSLHPLNVSGGEIVNCHLTGSIHNGITSGDVNFYCNGGYIHEFNGAYQEKLNGHMIAKMDHALIDEFYGGGADDAYGDTPQITGDINITCNNSYVKFFCGGPKFGNMASKKTVTVTATGSTFDEYYGASYGGTALTAFEKSHHGTSFSGNANITFVIPWTNYTSERLAYNSARRGIGVNFDLDFFQYAGGGQATGNQSFYVNFASLSLAKTGSVTSTMTNCTFNGHFFGGGCRGLVDGNVTSTLTDCIVKGNAYGGGYTPTATECMVYPETQPTYPVYKGLYGLFTKYVRTSEPEAYRWVQADDGHASGSVDKTNKLLYTSVDMTQMGVVTGDTSLTIKGINTVIGGNVFGGGAESKVSGNTNVVIGEQP